MSYLAPIILAFIFSVVLTPIVRKLAEKLKIVDYPSSRKIHKKPIPLLGGLAIFISFFIATIIFWHLGYIEDLKIHNYQIAAILLSGLILIFGGFLDDKYNLKPSHQIIWPILSILIVLFSGIRIEYITNPFGGVIQFSLAIGTLTAFFWLLGMVYTTKFLDGLDGLASGITAIAAIIIFIVSLYWDIPSSGTSVLALILAGSCLGFLVFNWHPAKIFLGEGGSVFCGFMLGVLSIISGSKIATALLIMGIPILDVVWVIIARILKGQSPVEGDRKHLHFRLLDIGLSHRQAVMFLYFVTAIFGAASLFLHSKGKIITLAILAIIMTALGSSLAIKYKYKKDEKAL
jgi:UDP-GlcNAc:undecaprenyl-phosphate GlcNAc-1-phosphate transferase